MARPFDGATLRKKEDQGVVMVVVREGGWKEKRSQEGAGNGLSGGFAACFPSSWQTSKTHWEESKSVVGEWIVGRGGVLEGRKAGRECV